MATIATVLLKGLQDEIVGLYKPIIQAEEVFLGAASRVTLIAQENEEIASLGELSEDRTVLYNAALIMRQVLQRNLEATKLCRIKPIDEKTILYLKAGGDIDELVGRVSTVPQDQKNMREDLSRMYACIYALVIKS